MLKKLFPYLKGYKKQSVLAPLFKMAEALFDLCVPLVTADIIDNGIVANDRNYILTRCGLLVLLAAAGLICSVTAQYFSACAAVGFAAAVRGALFSKILSLSPSQADSVGRSTLITRATDDIQRLQNGFNMTLRLLLRSPFIVFGSVILAFTVDVASAGIFLAAVAVLSVIVFAIMKITVKLHGTIQKKTDNVVSVTRENLTGARVIRAFNRQDDEQENMTEANTQAFDASVRAAGVASLTDPLTGLTVNLALIAVIWLGGIRINIGMLTQGQVVALVSYMSQILIELIKLADLISLISNSLACASRISSVLDMTPDMNYGNESALTGKEALRFEKVSFAYPDAGAESLSDISFTVPLGASVGIIGSTGSGKTSLVSLAERMYDATDGKVMLFGKPINEYSAETLRSCVCAVPQSASLFTGTIRSNMKWADINATDGAITDALRTAQAYDFVFARREGLDAVVEQNGRNLSGGQRQRLTIARALVGACNGGPRILILDDSSSALDYATDAALRRALREDCKGVTVLTVSQRASSIMNCDLILVLENGLLVGKGTHSQLIGECEVYREIFARSCPEKAKEAGIDE